MLKPSTSASSTHRCMSSATCAGVPTGVAPIPPIVKNFPTRFWIGRENSSAMSQKSTAYGLAYGGHITHVVPGHLELHAYCTTYRFAYLCPLLLSWYRLGPGIHSSANGIAFNIAELLFIAVGLHIDAFSRQHQCHGVLKARWAYLSSLQTKLELLQLSHTDCSPRIWPWLLLQFYPGLDSTYGSKAIISALSQHCACQLAIMLDGERTDDENVS